MKALGQWFLNWEAGPLFEGGGIEPLQGVGKIWSETKLNECDLCSRNLFAHVIILTFLTPKYSTWIFFFLSVAYFMIVNVDNVDEW